MLTQRPVAPVKLLHHHMTEVKLCNNNQHNIKVSAIERTILDIDAWMRQALTTEMVGLPASESCPTTFSMPYKTNEYKNMVCIMTQRSKLVTLKTTHELHNVSGRWLEGMWQSFTVSVAAGDTPCAGSGTRWNAFSILLSINFTQAINVYSQTTSSRCSWQCPPNQILYLSYHWNNPLSIVYLVI